MKLGNIEIQIGANELVLGAVVTITFCLLFKDTAIANTDLFKLGYTALIAWGAGYAMGQKSKGGIKE
jgi:hypothetical protein